MDEELVPTISDYIVVHFHDTNCEECWRTFPNSKRGRELAENFANRRRSDKHYPCGPAAVTIEHTDENKGIKGWIYPFESTCGLDEEDDYDEDPDVTG